MNLAIDVDRWFNLPERLHPRQSIWPELLSKLKQLGRVLIQLIDDHDLQTYLLCQVRLLTASIMRGLADSRATVVSNGWRMCDYQPLCQQPETMLLTVTARPLFDCLVACGQQSNMDFALHMLQAILTLAEITVLQISAGRRQAAAVACA